LARLLYLT